jgi:hypothetical protein
VIALAIAEEEEPVGKANGMPTAKEAPLNDQKWKCSPVNFTTSA